MGETLVTTHHALSPTFTSLAIEAAIEYIWESSDKEIHGHHRLVITIAGT